MSALKFLLKKEWSMGNGQCPECFGVPPSWHGHPCYKTSEKIGHEKNCCMAAAIKDLGGSPVMLGDYKSDVVYEEYITDSGFFSTRPKTKNGCPKINAMNKKFSEDLAAALMGSTHPKD